MIGSCTCSLPVLERIVVDDVVLPVTNSELSNIFLTGFALLQIQHLGIDPSDNVNQIRSRTRFSVERCVGSALPMWQYRCCHAHHRALSTYRNASQGKYTRGDFDTLPSRTAVQRKPEIYTKTCVHLE